MFLPAFRAFAFHHKRERVGREAFGQMQTVDVYVFKAERLLARFAIEVHVVVLHCACTATVAEFIV